MISNNEITAVLEDIYFAIKHRRRELRPQDRIVEDLAVDSLDAVDLMVALEQRYDIQLIDDPQAADVVTISDLMDLLTSAITAKA
jgi:acyl carrier protein